MIFVHRPKSPIGNGHAAWGGHRRYYPRSSVRDPVEEGGSASTSSKSLNWRSRGEHHFRRPARPGLNVIDKVRSWKKSEAHRHNQVAVAHGCGSMGRVRTRETIWLLRRRARQGAMRDDLSERHKARYKGNTKAGEPCRRALRKGRPPKSRRSATGESAKAPRSAPVAQAS